MIRKKGLLILLGQIIFLASTIIVSKNIICPFKQILKVPCPFCGMTRALESLLTGNIMESIYCNILLLPSMIIIILLDIIIVTEIIVNKKILTIQLKNKQLIIIILICLIVSLFSVLINWYHGI